MKTKLTIFFLLLATSMMAQELKVKSFNVDLEDEDARKYAVLDANDDPCALVKVSIADEGAEFEGDVVQQISHKGEWWVYMTEGSEYIEIKTSDYLPLTYEFKEPLKKSFTYKLVLEAQKKEITIDEAKKMVGGSARLPIEQIEANKTIKNTLDVCVVLMFPTDNSLVSNNIREYINEKLGDSFTGDLSEGQQLANYYVQCIFDKNKAEAERECKNIDGDRSDPLLHYVYYDSITVEYETEYLITMKHVHHFHSAGNIDEAANSDISYQTFRKTDGRRMDMTMFQNIKSTEFCDLYLEALRDYCHIYSGNPVSDEDLCMLFYRESIIDVKFHLSDTLLHPFITSRGMNFVYTGEIWPYSYGASPTATIPINQIKPYLKATLLELVTK